MIFLLKEICLLLIKKSTHFNINTKHIMQLLHTLYIIYVITSRLVETQSVDAYLTIKSFVMNVIRKIFLPIVTNLIIIFKELER